MMKLLTVLSGVVLTLGLATVVYAACTDNDDWQTGPIKLEINTAVEARATCYGGRDDHEGKTLKENRYLHCENAKYIKLQPKCANPCGHTRRFYFIDRANASDCTGAANETYHIGVGGDVFWGLDFSRKCYR